MNCKSSGFPELHKNYNNLLKKVPEILLYRVHTAQFHSITAEEPTLLFFSLHPVLFFKKYRYLVLKTIKTALKIKQTAEMYQMLLCRKIYYYRHTIRPVLSVNTGNMVLMLQY
jgi:hypothetical protein